MHHRRENIKGIGVRLINKFVCRQMESYTKVAILFARKFELFVLFPSSFIDILIPQ